MTFIGKSWGEAEGRSGGYMGDKDTFCNILINKSKSFLTWDKSYIYWVAFVNRQS